MFSNCRMDSFDVRWDKSLGLPQTHPPPCLFLCSSGDFRTITAFPANQPCFLGMRSHPSLLSPAEISKPPLFHPRLCGNLDYTLSCHCPRKCHHHLIPGPLSISTFSSSVVFTLLSLATPWTLSCRYCTTFEITKSNSPPYLHPGHGLT